MQTYLMLIKGSFSDWNQLSTERKNDLVAQFGSYAAYLAEKGYMRGGDSCGQRSFRIMEPAHCSEKSLLNPQTKDMVTGYFLIEVPSEAEALNIVRECPAFNCKEYVELIPCGH